MLSRLSIKNYVLIRSLEMSPSDSLSIITGETGAGKSIMIGAVGLLLGKRADTKALLSQDQKCVIEGLFEIGEYKLEHLFDNLDLDYDSQTIIRREISPSGKSRAFINDTPVRLEILREVGERLLDVHSQHDTLDLAEQLYQLKLLDSFSGTASILSKYSKAYQVMRDTEKSLKELQERASEIKNDADYNAFLLSELEELNLIHGEQEMHEQELSLLEHAEEIKQNLNQVIEGLSDSEHGGIIVLETISQFLKKVEPYSESLERLSQRLQSNIIDLNDLAREIENEDMNVEFDPQRQEEISQRLSGIYRLQQKHKVESISELIEIQEELAAKMTSSLSLDEDLLALEKDLEQKKELTLSLGEELSQLRNTAIQPICEQVIDILNNLSIPEADLKIKVSKTEPGPMGMDSVSILFSANKGVTPEPLKKVASGGEYSRLMFALKFIMAGKTSMPTIIFDEIDSGISGEVARQLGHLMNMMGQKHQIIAITHLPQVAARGQAHYFVYKETQKESTASQVRELNEEQRIDEIAKMIAGDNPSVSAMESARELVNQ